jgi:methionine aminopeptidase
VLKGIISARLVAGARIVDICKLGDNAIEQLVAPLYKSKKAMEKGVAFPTCVNVNNCVAHYSPLESDAAEEVLADGDIVKVFVRVPCVGACNT